MFWTNTDDRYQILNENVHNNSQDNVIALGIVILTGNNIVEKRSNERRTHFGFSQLKVFHPDCEVVIYQSL
jgi:hypothetical protein